MKITILDKKSLGDDTPFDSLYPLGEVDFYDATAPSEISERIKDSDVVIINKVKMTDAVISGAEKLKLICVFATGYDNIDLESARRNGVAVCNVPGYSTESVTLYTIATVSALCSRLIEYRNFVNSGEYTASGTPNRLVPVYHEICGKTWGIIGYGNIGKAVGKVAEALGARLIVNKRTPIEGVRCVDIDTLCREADIITIHCPLNEETREIINKDRIALMKDGVIIVNEARGAVLNENDVTAGVLSGKIGGFGCDVYSTEPFGKEHSYNKLLDKDNVILTPHAAWGAYESRERCIGIISENIKSFTAGKTLNRVDIIGQK